MSFRAFPLSFVFILKPVFISLLSKPMGNIHGAPPPRRGHRNGVAPPKPPPLDTITERPKGPRRPTSPDAESAESEGSGSPVEQQQQQQRKKVQKQGNTLAKLLTSCKPRLNGSVGVV